MEEEKKEAAVEEEVKEEAPVVEAPKKREAIDKQTAFIEFKQGPGQRIENSIL